MHICHPVLQAVVHLVVEVWREGRATSRLQRWQCGGIMHDMLKKGSWCFPLSKAQHLQLYVVLTQSSLVYLAVGCSAARCTCCLSSLACLTSVCSDLLRSWSLWRQCYSLAVALSSRSRHNLSLALSRFISVELHGEESSAVFSRSIGFEQIVRGSSCQLFTEH